MIIGFDASRAFRVDKTGTENYSFQLLKALAKIDKVNQYIVYIQPLTSSSAIAERYVKIFPKNFYFKQIAWPRLWTQGGLALQTFKDRLDVLFVPAHTLPVIRMPGLKTVVTVHDLGSEYLPQMHQLKQRLYLSFMQKYQLKTATKIIAVSKATKDDLIKRVGCDGNRIEVIYEGYDKKLFKPVKSDVVVNSLSQYGLVPKSYFLFVGTVQPRKNLERLIKAFSKFLTIDDRKWKMGVENRGLKIEKDNPSSTIHSQNTTFYAPPSTVKLVIAGSKGWLSDKIYELPKKLGIEDKVEFLGYVPEKNLPALYCGAIALTFPSLFEGFGLPILEAQACGCPVLTSNTSSMPEVAGYVRVNRTVAGKGAVLVNPYSTQDIIRGIRVIGGIRGKMIRLGFENIRRFSWEKCAQEIIKVLESV